MPNTWSQFSEITSLEPSKGSWPYCTQFILLMQKHRTLHRLQSAVWTHSLMKFSSMSSAEAFSISAGVKTQGTLFSTTAAQSQNLPSHYAGTYNSAWTGHLQCWSCLVCKQTYKDVYRDKPVDEGPIFPHGQKAPNSVNTRCTPVAYDPSQAQTPCWRHTC